ncbi:MAG TPA: helix-turn-helix transcriptional regulator [Cyclobacteriaceae bacterium]|nr:helix-turn-helix transcriptional regulator [Cyclobacteriaceae bacterium]
MLYAEHKPSKALEQYVKCFYTLEHQSNVLIEDYAFATGCIEVMFTLRGSPWQVGSNGVFRNTSPVEMWGQILKPLAFRIPGPGKTFGIRFYPATASFLLNDDVNNFNDGVFDLAGITGGSISELHAKLQDEVLVSQQISLVESYLLKRLEERSKVVEKITFVQRVMNEVTHKDFFDNIENVAGWYGISSRYLQKVFVQQTGLSPKLYMKINRFQNSLVMLGKKGVSLTSVAYACGYFDQSHFIREFKSFTGVSPSLFLPENSTAILASPNK